MGRLRTLALAAIALLGWASSSPARIHGQMYCWALDSELPVPCDQEEEDDEEASLDPRLAGVLMPSAASAWAQREGPSRKRGRR